MYITYGVIEVVTLSDIIANALGHLRKGTLYRGAIYAFCVQIPFLQCKLYE